MANVYLFKVSDRNTRKRYEICSKVTIKTLDADVVLVSLFLTLNMFHFYFLVFLLLNLNKYLFARYDLYTGIYSPNKILWS